MDMKSFVNKDLQEINLYDKLIDIWENGESKKNDIKKYYEYWKGVNPDSDRGDTKYSWFNVVKQIVETQVSAILDAQFSTAVLPAFNTFSDIKTLKDQQTYADIIDDVVKSILNDNKIESIKEKSCRWGIICGFGASQVVWDDINAVEGEIKITSCDPQLFRWDQFAKSMDDLSFIGYQLEINPSIAKERFARNNDGSYNEELCQKIDQISKSKDSKISDGKKKGIVAVQNTDNNSADIAYVYEKPDGGKITAGKIVDLVVMFLKDDTLYVPKEDDTEEEKKENDTLRKMYPNGRMVIFSPNKNKKVILLDEPIPKSLKNLGNIDFFTPTDFDGIAGRGEVVDIMSIQDRINGALNNIKTKMANSISTLCLRKEALEDGGQSAFVTDPVVFIEAGADMPVAVSNNTLADIEGLMNYVVSLKQMALDTARLNETMINGVRQTGTTSAEQVDALQESPMASIRSKQRNFKDYMINMCEKIIALIQEKYSIQRLVKLTSNIDGAKYAKFGENPDGQRYVELVDETGRQIQIINVDPEWKFKVEVTAGTEIPRSRRESALIMDKLYHEGTLGDINDVDIKEQYLRAIDVPNYRAFIQILRKKQEELAKNPPQVNIKDILMNKDLAKGFADMLNSLEFNSNAKAEVLTVAGFQNTKVDKVQDAPAQSVASKADFKEVAAIAPNVVSDDPQMDVQGRDVAAAIIDKKGA